MAERDFAAAWPVPHRVRVLPGTSIEVVRPFTPREPPRHALFDFDGTLSLIREGWLEIMVAMLVQILSPLARSGETPASIESGVRDFVADLTGRQTIYQMMRLAREVGARGGVPREPAAYKAEYHRLLMARIAARREGLADGSLAPEELLVPGSLDVLAGLQERGVSICIASGTDVEYVREEARLLGLHRFAGDRIYGALPDHTRYSKKRVIDGILREHRVDPARFLAFGDGFVEIADCRAVDGIAVAVASDEAGRSGRPDAWKRERLIGAGADFVIPDFSDAEALLDHLWSGEMAV